MRLARLLACSTLLSCSVACGSSTPAATGAADGHPSGRAQPTASARAAASAESVPATRIASDGVHTTAGGTEIPLLKGWWLTPQPAFTQLEDPERELWLGVVEARSPTPEAAIREAWASVRPGFDRPTEQILTPPPTGGFDELAVVTYADSAASERAQLAVAKRKGDRTVVALIDGKKAALDRHGAEIDRVVGGIKLPGAAEEDLSAVSPAPLEGERLRRFDQFVAEARDKMKVPGVVVSVVQHGHVVFERGYGVRELGKPASVDPDTLMLIGSTTKPMTTLLMAKLVDEGRFRWETPVTELMPSFALGDAKATAVITMQHLVCACTGMPRRDFELLFDYGKATPEKLLDSLKTMAPTTGFGETFQYSNQLVAAAGFVVGHLLEPARPVGEAYDTAMQRKVFDPIGMKSTTLSFERALRVPNRASPHGRTLGFVLEPLPIGEERFLLPLRPSGGAWSNARDLSRLLLTELARGQAPDGTRVVSEANLVKRWQPQVATQDKGSYGLGWGIGDKKGIRCIQHGGDTLGFSSLLAFYPDKDLGLVVLANAQSPGAFRNAVRDRLFELVFGGKEQAAERIDFALRAVSETVTRANARVEQPADPAWLKPYLGRWRHPALGTITVAVGPAGPSLDAGDWKSAVARKQAPDGTVTLVLTEPPFAGLELLLEGTGAGRALVLRDAQQDYRFVAVSSP